LQHLRLGERRKRLVGGDIQLIGRGRGDLDQVLIPGDGFQLIAGQVARDIDIAVLQQQQLLRPFLHVADEEAFGGGRFGGVRIGVEDHVVVGCPTGELIRPVAG
jgi:hypothetical protein